MYEKKFQIFYNAVDELEKYFKDKNTKGKCFETAFEIFIFLAKRKIYTTLVHANITMEDKILGHAWIMGFIFVILIVLAKEV